MRIYWIKAQAPRRVLAVAKHLGIEAELIEVNVKAGGFKTADYTALNPNRKAPTLVDGELVLWESSAIMAHLCVKADSDMWPARNAAEQVEVLRWLSWNDCHWSPAVGPRFKPLPKILSVTSPRRICTLRTSKSLRSQRPEEIP